MSRLSAALALLAAVGLASMSCEKSDMPLSERYPGPWREDVNIGITKALAAKKIRDCGQYKYRESSVNTGEYLVYCTRDGVGSIESLRKL
jgi:hypothetical protein